MWRADCAKDEKHWLNSFAEGNAEHALQEEISHFLLSSYTGDLSDGTPISVVRIGVSDVKTLIAKFGIEDVTDYLVFEKEVVYRLCDERTRDGGFIVKAVTVIDFAEFSLLGPKFSKSFFTALGDSSTKAQSYYPQMQAKTIVINVPTSGKWILSLMKSVMPKSSMEKLVQCGAKGGTANASAKACPFIRRFDGLEAIPPFLGGTGPMPETLVPVQDRGEAKSPMQKLTIKARSVETVEFEVEEPDSLVSFEAQIEAHHVNLSAKVNPYDDAPKQKGPFHFQFHLPKTPLRDTDGLTTAVWEIEDPGTLVIKFDNSFSKVKAKKVSYRVELIEKPQEEEERSYWDRMLGRRGSRRAVQWQSANAEQSNCLVM